MKDAIEISPEYPLRRFSMLPHDWTGFTSAAALCLVLPIHHRGTFTLRARKVLAAGIDRYAPTFNEGDALALVTRAEHYLAENLSLGRRFELGDLREMLRLHAGRLLEGRGREALTSATYLATHVLSLCGDIALTPGELWVLNEAMLDARPISSTYETVDNVKPQDFYANVEAVGDGWLPGAYLRVPVGRREALFQITQLDAISYANLAAYDYGLSPSWPLSSSRDPDGRWYVPFGVAVDVLTTQAFPALAQLRKRDLARFSRLPDVLCSIFASQPSADPEMRSMLVSYDAADPVIGIRLLEYMLGELRHLDLEARWELYMRLVDRLSPLGASPLLSLIETMGAGVLALSKKAQQYPTKYFMPE